MKSSIHRSLYNHGNQRRPFLQRKPPSLPAATRPFISAPAIVAAKTPTPSTPTTKSASGKTLTWPALRDTAIALYAKRDLAAAKQAYQKAIHFAIANMTPPPGIKWMQPNPGDIQIDFGLSDSGAQTKQSEVEQHPADYWKWMYFGAGAISDTPFFTEAITYHELVHVVQYTAYWNQYQSAKTSGQTWADFMKPYSEAFFVKGPEELEAHITSLSFLERVDFSKKETADLHRGLLASLLSMYSYVEQSAGKQQTTLTTYRDKVLAHFYKSQKQEEMSSVFWSMLMREPPATAVMKQVLKDLWPIAKPAYARPVFTSLYNDFLKDHHIVIKKPKAKTVK